MVQGRDGQLAADDFQTLPRVCDAARRGGMVGDHAKDTGERAADEGRSGALAG